jgi:23S rRNA (cytosine1962-C5)-methyltransferase
MSSLSHSIPAGESHFHVALSRALDRRKPLIGRPDAQAFRAFSGSADGVDGVFVDVYDCGAVLIVHEGAAPRNFNPTAEAAAALEVLKRIGVRGVYVKTFARDRSRMGGELPAEVTDSTPAAGEGLPEAILIGEKKWKLEIRLYDGLSTGLFLDQRENRGFVAEWSAARVRDSGKPALLNTFAYTCAFSVAAAMAGAITTSVDVSARYLDWGKRNFSHNNLDIAPHRFAKMDTFEFFAYARRKSLRYDLIILDPPSFASGSKSKKIRPWSSVSDYARLVKEAAGLLNPKGVIFASTNTRELCRPGRLEDEIFKGLGRRPKWVKLPAPPLDFSGEKERFAARAFE